MATMTLPRYAERLGVRAPYLYRLKREGKLVLAADGSIEVEKTDRALADAIDWQLELTRGLGKVASALIALGVVDPAARAKTAARAEPDAALEAAGDRDDAAELEDAPRRAGEPPEPGPLTGIRIRRETAEATRAELLLLKDLGLLVSRDELDAEFEPLFTTVRESLLAIPDRLAPVVAAEADEHQVHRMIDAEIRATLNEIADRAGAAAARLSERPAAAVAAA
jgi:hypothetical protein